jgi:tetratricopeptide (TPR) repeat protein
MSGGVAAGPPDGGPYMRMTGPYMRMMRQYLVVVVLLLLGGPLPYAQTTPEALLNSGRYDEVDKQLQGATDARSIALRARASIERGRYAEAEKLLAGPAAAQPASDAALELGRLQLYLGRTADGRRTLNRLIDSSRGQTVADFLRRGIAHRGLGEFQEANVSFREGNRVKPDDAAINLAWGELLLEKYNLQDALKSFEIAVKADPTLVGAQVGIATLAAQGNPPLAKKSLDQALQINPRSVPALLLQAEMALDSREREAAAKLIRQALDTNPNSLEAHALMAAVAFLDGRDADFESSAQAALKINPTYGDAYRIAGSHAGRNYRFDEAAALTRRALTVQPDSSNALIDLGSHLLRTGDEPAAKQALDRAFKLDPFHDTTKNSLELLDALEKFVTITEGDLVIRLDPEEAPVMREQLVPLAREALATLSKRYQFTPKGPILLEMFPRHDDFAVRTIGLPGFEYALGACFGRVVTLDSPRARPPGEFSWQETLWHEMAHVITLQMSNNRIPRWLSEGASVFEERRARPEWGRETDFAYAQALNDNKLLKLESIQDGLSNPELTSLTYHQASFVVEHLMETYGEPKFWELLRAFGRGLETDAAFKAVYAITIADLQTAFDARMDKQFAEMRAALKRPEIKGTPGLEDLKVLAAANPQNFGVQMQLGVELRKAKDVAGALAAFERAAKILPRAAPPYSLIASVALEQKDNARAIQALEALVRIDHNDVESARLLASLLQQGGDEKRLEDAYARVVATDPFDAAAQSGIGRMALKRGDADGALRALRSALALKPPDRATTHTDLAEAYLMKRQTADAKREILAALELAPAYERAQDLLLRIGD